MDNKLLKIFTHFGYKKQVEKQKEEDAEFLEAVQEYMDNPTKENLDHAIEELGDKMNVGIGLVLGAMKTHGIYNDKAEIIVRLMSNAYAQGKLDRTLERMKTGYYD